MIANTSGNESSGRRHEKHFRRFAREWAMQFMFQYDLSSVEDQVEFDAALARFWEQLEVAEDRPDGREYRRGRRAAEALVRGAFARLRELDDLIAARSAKWNIDRMDPVDRNVMRVAIYEMLYCENVPLVVSINEAVEIGKTFGSERTGAFVNGILNSIKDALANAPADDRGAAASKP